MKKELTLEESDNFEVEAIVDWREAKTRYHSGEGPKRREFKVLWKGYPIEAATWEPEEHLDDARSLLDIFLTRNNLAAAAARENDVAPMIAEGTMGHVMKRQQEGDESKRTKKKVKLECAYEEEPVSSERTRANKEYSSSIGLAANNFCSSKSTQDEGSFVDKFALPTGHANVNSTEQQLFVDVKEANERSKKSMSEKNDRWMFTKLGRYKNTEPQFCPHDGCFFSTKWPGYLVAHLKHMHRDIPKNSDVIRKEKKKFESRIRLQCSNAAAQQKSNSSVEVAYKKMSKSSPKLKHGSVWYHRYRVPRQCPICCAFTASLPQHMYQHLQKMHNRIKLTQLFNANGSVRLSELELAAIREGESLPILQRDQIKERKFSSKNDFDSATSRFDGSFKARCYSCSLCSFTTTSKKYVRDHLRRFHRLDAVAASKEQERAFYFKKEEDVDSEPPDLTLNPPIENDFVGNEQKQTKHQLEVLSRYRYPSLRGCPLQNDDDETCLGGFDSTVCPVELFEHFLKNHAKTLGDDSWRSLLSGAVSCSQNDVDFEPSVLTLNAPIENDLVGNEQKQTEEHPLEVLSRYRYPSLRGCPLQDDDDETCLGGFDSTVCPVELFEHYIKNHAGKVELGKGSWRSLLFGAVFCSQNQTKGEEKFSSKDNSDEEDTKKAVFKCQPGIFGF